MGWAWGGPVLYPRSSRARGVGLCCVPGYPMLMGWVCAVGWGDTGLKGGLCAMS